MTHIVFSLRPELEIPVRIDEIIVPAFIHFTSSERSLRLMCQIAKLLYLFYRNIIIFTLATSTHQGTLYRNLYKKCVLASLALGYGSCIS